MQMLNRVPLTALRAVEAVGRLGTLAAAATELGISVGAVSLRVQNAEAALGRTLFVRTSKGMTLTPIGAEVVPRLTRGMAELASAVALADPAREARLTISVAPLFASRWLVWRLAKFYADHPEIQVRVDASTVLRDPEMEDVDVCIRVGVGPWDGTVSERLVPQRVFPVASPALAARLTRPADLANVPIIRESDELANWDVWLAPHGLSKSSLGSGPTYSDGGLCLDAAIAGQGVFLAWETLAASAIEQSHLVAPFAGRIETVASYWLVTSTQRRSKPAVSDFLRWIRQELADSQVYCKVQTVGSSR